MKPIKVGAAVMNQTPLAWDSNKAHILAAIEAARAQEVTLLCLPEMCITGYGCEDAFHAPSVHAMALRALDEILPATRGMVVSLGLPLAHHNGIFNAACLVADGRILGFVAKRYLAGDGIHYEPRWFKPWPEGRRVEVDLGGGRTAPLGDVYFDVGGVKIGFEICEDAWVAKRPGGELSLLGVDVILNPSASHFAFGKLDVRKRFVLEGSRAFGVSYIYANLLGNEAGRAIYDGGALIASAGRLLAVGQRFGFGDVAVTSATVDVGATRMIQARTGSFKPVVEQDLGTCVRVDFQFPGIEPAAPAVDVTDASDPAAWEHGPGIKAEEFARAVALGLFDYMRKSRSRGFVVSLSGGADSSAVACLVALMVRLGVRDLGLAGLTEKLTYLGRTTLEARGPEDLIRELLLCVYQGSENSSETTRASARAVAEALGAEFRDISIGDLVRGYTALVGSAIGRDLDWERDDLALQNIQARVRGPSVWMLANVRSALLLATSNRSEAAVGYATMDGDTCGGLAPIAGIDKAYLREWLRWLEREGPSGVGPIPALEVVNCLQPGPELRPLAAGQTGEKDLMPFPLLDAIERVAIRDKQSPLEVFRTMRARFREHSKEELAAWIERFFRLWCRNQWKRERYAPSFHLDDESLDPKTWCRFPILSGGYEVELAEMRAYVAGAR